MGPRRHVVEVLETPREHVVGVEGRGWGLSQNGGLRVTRLLQGRVLLIGGRGLLLRQLLLLLLLLWLLLLLLLDRLRLEVLRGHDSLLANIIVRATSSACPCPSSSSTSTPLDGRGVA